MWVKCIEFECNKNVQTILGLWVLFWCIRIKNNDFRMWSSVCEFVFFPIKWIHVHKIISTNLILYFVILWWKKSHRSSLFSKQHTEVILVKFGRAIKIPFDKSQVLFASKTARGCGKFCGACFTSEKNLMKQ